MPFNILLVDDDKDFRSEFKEYLDNYNVVEASNGEEALKILRRPNEIDLVLLDVMMPGPRGTAVLHEIKKISPSLFVVILTGYSTKEVAVESLKGKADDYLEKPVDLERTKRVIEKLLGSRQPQVESGIIEKVKSIIEKNLDKKLSLQDVAEMVHLNPKYLSRLFKQKTRIGYSDFKVRSRIEAAKAMLTKMTMKVSDVSQRIGYENPESFIRAFQRITGVSPTEFRETSKTKKGPWEI